MYDSQMVQPYSGTHVVRVHSPTMWRHLLIGANIGGAVLVLILIVSRFRDAVVAGLVAGLIPWFLANAVLIPMAIVQLRKRLTLDFASGTLAVGGVTYPASELQALIQTSRHYMGTAHLLTLVYRGGSVEVQVDGFTPSPETRARNLALLAFIWQCLPVPEHHAQYIGEDLTLVKQLIGKREAAALLRS